ncbi:hypothetical protein DFJ73DRAFT_811117 [Zopfochytrium polystomum]|nr:hypothetical protein DFJ73DRAFT_811117 [Zopfochytrium polystomum]
MPAAPTGQPGVGSNGPTNAAAAAGPTAGLRRLSLRAHPHGREITAVKELCSQFQNLSQAQRRDNSQKSLKDLIYLKNLTDGLKQKEELSIIHMDSIMAVVHSGHRKQILKAKQQQHMANEQEMSVALQQHRDEFGQFIWKRRIESKRDLRALFQTGPGLVCKFGDMIADAALESIQLFDKVNNARLCKDAIKSGLCAEEDIPDFFARKITLLNPRGQTYSVISPNHLEFKLSLSTPPGEWTCLYGNQGPSAKRLVGKQLVTSMILQSYETLRLQMESPSGFSYISFLARLIDLAHPTHQLQANALAYPHTAPAMLKRRLLTLGYDISPATEDVGPIDHAFVLKALSQMYQGLEKSQRFYFEFLVPDRVCWRVGLQSGTLLAESNVARFPGDDESSFCFSFDGSIFHRGVQHPYAQLPPQGLFGGTKTFGVLLDLYRGNVSLVFDGKTHSPAFGRGARAFSSSEQEAQRHVLTGTTMIPAVALQMTSDVSEYEERPFIQLNFGRSSFTHFVHASSFEAGLPVDLTRGLESSILDTLSPGRDKQDLDEEEKIQMAAEKNYILRSTLPQDTLKTFSQFPPSIYRRSLACTRIQRAWRRYRGRIERAILREKQYRAATLIQRVARKKLRQIRAKKNEAAAIIQKNWRRKLFIWMALLRCIYKQPLSELHRCATVIQRKWKHWSMFRNSPIATKYNARMEVLVRAVNTIINWWRPLHASYEERSKMGEKFRAAVTIQRVYRGYALRQRLRPDMRKKLLKIGQFVARHRGDLLRIRGAYVIQSAWRSYQQRKVRSEKIRTRNRAAARLQAFWKGYWVRSHIHLRFTYGEAVFLTAVCKALRNCHFILKMYRPCGIVCPRYLK